ncbi:hypothetical protein CRUP_011150 [Coryphaenoides rupestris]|nr:hypothetical protein CRUP_011150 [Coryphaenoides rupestris]
MDFIRGSLDTICKQMRRFLVRGTTHVQAVLQSQVHLLLELPDLVAFGEEEEEEEEEQLVVFPALSPPPRRSRLQYSLASSGVSGRSKRSGSAAMSSRSLSVELEPPADGCHIRWNRRAMLKHGIAGLRCRLYLVRQRSGETRASLPRSLRRLSASYWPKRTLLLPVIGPVVGLSPRGSSLLAHVDILSH